MQRGVVVSFEEDRGFGFIRSGGQAKDVFVHVSDVIGGKPLHPGQRVGFETRMDERGPRAIHVQPGRRGLSPEWSAGLGLAAFLVVAMIALWALHLPLIGAWLIAINVLTFAVYAWDKRRAGSEKRRVPEAVLLGLGLIGGSPAAMVAMKWLRHKTRKWSFLVPFWLTVLVQVAAMGWWFSTKS